MKTENFWYFSKFDESTEQNTHTHSWCMYMQMETNVVCVTEHAYKYLHIVDFCAKVKHFSVSIQIEFSYGK